MTWFFAALEVASGRGIEKCRRHHSPVEFRAFLDRIEASMTANLEIRVILDTCGAHKTALIHSWLARHPRYRLHFTPDRRFLDQARGAARRAPH